MFGNLPTVPRYRSTAPTSNMGQIPQGGYNFNSLAQAADQERLAQQQRATDRQNNVVSGYDQQIQNSRAMGDQGYQRLAADYDLLTNDARDTRSRNMERIDKFGNSMRSDLNVKAQQSMASASQNAIKRGLGNTTVSNSLQRGAQFDNTRQQLALEDQLLQNRISTDMNLSAAYQGSLNTRATGLNQQFNQNMNNENSLTSQRLGYIGGIQESMDGVGMVSNLYGQGLGMENDNQQRGMDRELTTSQSALDRSFRAGESQLERDARLREADIDRSWRTGESTLERNARITEAETQRGWQTNETRAERDSRVNESAIDRSFRAGESRAERDSRVQQETLDRNQQQQQFDRQQRTTISQAALDRSFQGDQSLLQREAQKQEADINRQWQAEQTRQDQLFRGKESASDREERQQQAELDRQWQQRQAEQQRNTTIAEAQRDREQQTRESSADRASRESEGEKSRLAQNDPNYGKTKVANPNYGQGSKYGGYRAAPFIYV